MQNRLIKVKKNRNSGSRTDKVASRVREIISRALLEESVLMGALAETPVTVSSVNISPDLKHATVFVLPLGQDIPDGFEKAMNELSPEFNRIIASQLTSKYTPRVLFRADFGFERASKLHSMINKVAYESNSKNNASNNVDDNVLGDEK